jgi:hypothetical protein
MTGITILWDRPVGGKYLSTDMTKNCLEKLLIQKLSACDLEVSSELTKS